MDGTAQRGLEAKGGTNACTVDHHKKSFHAYWNEMKRRQRRLALERLAGRGVVKKKMIQKKLK